MPSSAYSSDLDLLLVHGGRGPDDQAEAERAWAEVHQFIAGDTPATLVYDVDLDLRPEGRNGPVVRSLEGYRAYFERWAQTWERQAMVRARPVAGDLGARAGGCSTTSPRPCGRRSPTTTGGPSGA